MKIFQGLFRTSGKRIWSRFVLYSPWVELTKAHNIKWEPSWQDKYTGPHGGPPAGPTQFIVDVVRSAKGLADIFFASLPLAFFERVAQLITKYCYDDWVVQRRKKELSSGKYCRMCYRKQLTTELSAKDRQQRCRISAMGCPICKEPIFKECWKEGYDKHA